MNLLGASVAIAHLHEAATEIEEEDTFLADIGKEDFLKRFENKFVQNVSIFA